MLFGPKYKDYYTGFCLKSFLDLSELKQKVDASFSNYDLLNAAVFWLTNSEREKHGLIPFMFHYKLRQMATLHSHQMRAHRFFNHENPYEPRYKTLNDRLDYVKDSSFNGFMAFGENIALCPTLNGPKTFIVRYENGVPHFYDNNGEEMHLFTCLEYALSVVKGWMNSPGHRANILNPSFEYLGCGCAGFEKEGNNYSILYFNLTQNFGGGLVPASSKHIRCTFNPRAENPSTNNKFNASFGGWGQNKSTIMASIKLVFASTGEEFPVNDLDMDSVTNNELLEGAVSNNVFPPAGAGYEYKLVGKDGKPISDNKPLSELGFNDGDTIKVLPVAIGA